MRSSAFFAKIVFQCVSFSVPIPTYILGPTNQDQLAEFPTEEADFELCQNVYYLGMKQQKEEETHRGKF